ncbi:MAG: Cell surface glycoprotein [Candidatus Methanogaster sp.]|nr:MAG: Cell surface glycoprotein [ANME-2 cluster archaeon]
MTRLLLVAAAVVATLLAAVFFCPTAAAALYANPDADVQIVGLPEQVYAGGESFFVIVLANDQPFFDESLDEEGAVGVCLNITHGIVTAIEGSTFATNTSVGYDSITLYQDYINKWNCTLAVVRFAPTGAGDAVHINASGWIKDKDKPLFSDRYVATDSDDASSEIIDYSNLYDVSTLSELALQRKAFYNNSIKMLGAIVGDGSIDSQVNMAWFGAIMWTESLSYTLLTIPTTPVELVESFDEYTNLETYGFGLDTVFMSIESIIDQMWTVTQYTGKVSDAQNELRDLEDALTRESEYWTARNENGLEDVFGWDDCASGWLRGEELILERANENLRRVIHEAKKDIDAGTSDEADLYAYNVAKTALAFGENDLKYVRSVRDELPVDSDGNGLFDFEERAEPIPSLTNLEPSIEIAVGETRDLVFTLTNAGNDSDVGYLDLSVSSGIEIVANSSDASDMLTYTKAPGESAFFSDGYEHPLTYSLFGAYKPYAGGESATVTITIEATAAGEEWLKYRLSMMNSSGEYIRIPNAGVKDQQGWYAHETTVTVIDPANIVPAADAGCDQEVSEGTAVTLNGSGSSDTDGAVVEYVWREGGSVIGSGCVIGRTFSAGTHTVVLTVTDDGGKSDSDTVVVAVTANAAPVADAGCDQSVVSGAVVTLDGSGSSDSDGAIVYYEWQEDGAVLGNGATLETVFAPGVHEITLYVVDDGGKVGSDEVGVEVSGGVPEEEWNVTFGGEYRDVGSSVQQTSDGGYIISGLYSSGGNWHDLNVWLMKVDSNGMEEWNKTFGSGSDGGHSVQQTSDGGYIIVGTYWYGIYSDVWLIKTDSNGNTEWDSRFKTSYRFSTGNSVQQTSDGGYIITGDTGYDLTFKIYLIKTDSDGNKEWDKTFGGLNHYAGGCSVEQTVDGGYIVAGSVDGTWDSNRDVVYLIKTDSKGNEEWDKRHGYGFGMSVQQTSNGGYIITGYLDDDIVLIKTDSNGNEEWATISEGFSGKSVQQTEDGGYILTGWFMSVGVGLIKIDSNGNKEWNMTFFGNEESNRGNSVQQTEDGGYILTGARGPYSSSDAWLIKLSPEGDTTPPFLTITSHENGDTTYTSPITVAGTASDPSGIASVTVNGALANGAADWSTWNKDVTLVEGENTITVVATNNTGGSTTKTVTVWYGTADIYVNTTGWWRHGETFNPSSTPIQAAVDAANTGNRIIVESGTYPEHVVINKQITMKGVGYPVVDGEGTGTVVWILADGVTIESLKVMRCDPARENTKEGISIDANACTIDKCIVTDNNIGLGTGSKDSGKDNVISNCEFTDNRIGLVICDGEQNTVRNNHFMKCGLILDNAKNNLVTDNIIELDPTPGISIYNGSDNNIIVNNTIRSNSMVAFEIVGSEWGPTSNDNKIYHNNIIDNGWEYQAYDDGNNQWDNGAEGNYWSDYEGEDADDNGIGDIPYDKIGDPATMEKSGAKDNYPLMEPWTGDADTTPPELTITAPRTGETVYTSTITVAGTASDPSGITSVTVNGALASGAADWGTWSADVTLAVGENTLTVVATNTTGGSTTKTINVTYTPLLDGKVLSSSINDGIENATVTLVGTGKTNKTGANGYYSFSGVADGSYTLTASKPGYTFSPVDIVVSESTRASPIIGTIDTTVINADITSTVVPSGSFRPGDSVEVTITVKNTGTIEHTFCVGYSVRDPEDAFWDAPYVPVTLSPDESATETLSWTVQPGAPVGSYDVYTAAWATQHWSYLYDNLDREVAHETFSVQSNPISVPGWTLNSDERYNVLVDGKGYTAIWAANDLNNNISWMVYDDSGKVPDLVAFQRAAKTATVAKMLGSDTTYEVESLRFIQEGIDSFTDLTYLGKFALWVRNTGAYLAGKFAIMSASGGASLTTEMPAKAALKVAKEEIAKELSEKIQDDIQEIITGETSMKDELAKLAIEEMKQSASKLGIAADTLEAHGEGRWTYYEANHYYDNYKYGTIDGLTYMNLSYELQPGSDFASQMFGACNEAIKGLTSGAYEIDLAELINKVEDIKAINSSAIVRKKHENTFAVTDTRFGIDAIKLWNAYQDINKVGGTLMCPGSLHAYDSEGRHVGMNLTGDIDLEIPNSYYSGPDAEPEIIRICIPQGDNITFYVDNATTTGTFNLTLEKQMNMTLESVYYLNISINETTVVSVNTNNGSNPDYLMEIDGDGDGTTDNVTEPTHILINHAPSISITTPAGVQSGDIPLPYNLTDAESDNCTIMAQYSLDNATWLDASVGEAGCGVINLTSTPAGVNHTFVWASGTDIPDTNATVYFRIRPYDGGMAGDYATTNAFPVDNRVRGDLNADGILTPADAAIALEIAVGSRPCDPATLAAADVSGDGKVTSLDALMIMQAAADAIEL